MAMMAVPNNPMVFDHSQYMAVVQAHRNCNKLPPDETLSMADVTDWPTMVHYCHSNWNDNIVRPDEYKWAVDDDDD